jgi:hypothetical protein
VIAKGEMVGVLLDACPSFAPAWDEFLSDWQDERNDLPLYLALGDLARHLCALLAVGKTETFPAVFAAVERLITEGDSYVEEAIVIGLLEGLQNANLHTGTTPEQFRPFLGPEGACFWDALNEFWNGRGGAPDPPRPSERDGRTTAG